MPKDLVASDGAVAWSASHSAYGRIVSTYADPDAQARYANNPVKSPFRLLGQVADEDAELCWTRFRCFDPETGTWISTDPLEAGGGLNLYALNGSPTSTVDELGLEASKHEKGKEGEVVRRFMSRQDAKRAKKQGIPFDASAKHPGIDATTTDIDPVNPDRIKEMTGARNADAFVDIDISGKDVVRRKTKEGHHEIVIMEDIKPEDIVGSGRTKKSQMSPDDD